MNFIWENLVNAAYATFSFYFALSIYIFILGVLGEILVGFWANLLGEKRSYYLFSPGVFFHELSHATVGILMRFKIKKISFFQYKEGNKYLGYVESYSTILSEILSSISYYLFSASPALIGSLVLTIASKPLTLSSIVKNSWISVNFSSVGSTWYTTKKLVELLFLNFLDLVKNFTHTFDFSNWYFYIFLYVVSIIGMKVPLSDLDWEGIFHSVVSFFVFSFFLYLIRISEIIKFMMDCQKNISLIFCRICLFLSLF